MEENRLTEEEVQGIAGGGKAIDYIERELSDYLYDFDSYS